MATALTDRQQSVLRLIFRVLNERGFPPTFREIGAHEGIHSTNGVRGVLDALEKKGYILRHRYQSRAIEITDQAMQFLQSIGDIDPEPAPYQAETIELQSGITSRVTTIPIVGNVAAGTPITAEQNVDGYIALDADYAPRGENFALRVRGQSMINAGIHDGDVVICRIQEDGEPGDIVVALIGEEATVKYYRPERDRIVLEAANEYFGPITIERDAPDFRILGKVVGLYRRY